MHLATPAPFSAYPIDVTAALATTFEYYLNLEAQPLSHLAPFAGRGLYVIEYHGEKPLYDDVILINNTVYVGIAWRANDPYSLWNRLKNHINSIMEAQNLDINDFYVKLVITEDATLYAAETDFIEKLEPVWNNGTGMSGFGAKHQGSNREKGSATEWDAIHPGRNRVGTPKDPLLVMMKLKNKRRHITPAMQNPQPRLTYTAEMAINASTLAPFFRVREKVSVN